MRLRTLDLFCGGGGSSWGAKLAGADIVCGIDAWDTATKTFKDNFQNAKALNLTLCEHSRVSDLGGIGPIDLILASPECTNHTCAKGSGPRDEDSRRTATYVLSFARALKPRWIVVENVVHMRSWNGYAPLISELERTGYFVLPQVLNAADFGVPQKRRRLFLLCDRDAKPSPVKANRKYRSAKDIIQMDGPWKSGPLENGRRAAGTLARAERAIDALGRKVPFLIVYYGSDGSGGWQPLDRPLRTLTTLDRFGLVTWQGNTPMLRMLQIPELKRAMGFDDEFKLTHGTRRDQIRLIGNGVCPPVMKAIVRSLTARVQNRKDSLYRRVQRGGDRDTSARVGELLAQAKVYPPS
jgi:DNA (cytosine-5)-methyltransferase 1